MAVAKTPEVLSVVVEVPGGSGEYLASGKLDEKGVDDAIEIIFWFVGKPRDEAVDDKCQEKMLVINVVDAEHRTAVE